MVDQETLISFVEQTPHKMNTKVLKTEGNVITAVLRGSKVLKVGELNPKDKIGYVVSFFNSSGVIWAVLTTGEQINVNQIL